MASFKEKLVALARLVKPLQWTKSFGNMLLGFALASNFTGVGFEKFFLGFVSVGPLLWGGLYALNDWTDWEKDKQHPVKKKRPIPSGEVSPRTALIFSVILIASSFALGFFLNNFLFLACIFAMLVNQLLYTYKPLELKKKPVVDMVSGSLINPLFRFYSGWVLVSPKFNAPIEIIACILSLQFGGYALYRLASAKHDKEMQYKSSVVVFGEKKARYGAYLAIAIGAISFFIAIYNNVLQQKFLWVAAVALLPLPIYWKAMRHPEQMDMRKMYNTIYIHALIIMIAFFSVGYYF